MKYGEYQRQAWATREERGVEGISKEIQRAEVRGGKSASEKTFRFQERCYVILADGGLEHLFPLVSSLPLPGRIVFLVRRAFQNQL